MRYYGKIHSKLPIFCIKSVKIYTGQKKITREFSWLSWQIWGMHREWKKLDNARSNIRWEFALAATGFRTDRGRGLSIFCIKVLKIFLGFSNFSIYIQSWFFLSISCANMYFEICHLRVACKNKNMTMYFGKGLKHGKKIVHFP